MVTLNQSMQIIQGSCLNKFVEDPFGSGENIARALSRSCCKAVSHASKTEDVKNHDVDE